MSVTDTSLQAFESVKPQMNELQALTFKALSSRKQTNAELAESTGLYLYTVSPRVTELVKKGLVRDSGERRTTTRGRKAIVWETVA